MDKFAYTLLNLSISLHVKGLKVVMTRYIEVMFSPQIHSNVRRLLLQYVHIH